ncbi:hypothetical protein [Alienimonas californiensis]|uniref:Nickel uptake substrate-specific transmembrane region n=1 Tax=Alienimonas californiensis TaxID=2527989 RepID=A0A517PBF2_9PLAN|nr:hypothetical protein [Alienimonas californiensis]QDT16682.1 hypothetical protein CA12_27880 [Alienimonas californiensis]
MKFPAAPLTALALSAALVGCSSNEPAADAAPVAADDQAHGDHDHAAEGRDHSGEHGHGAGPHDGTVTDWGGGAYHPEFLVDHDKQQATVYLHGPDEKTPAPIAAESIRLTIVEPEIDVELAADPQEGDPEGKASRFVGTDPGLGVVREYEGTISGLIDGTPYTGDFKEVAHGHSEEE